MSRYAVRILQALRDGQASDWPSLCDVFDIGPRIDTPYNTLLRELRELHTAGLVEYDLSDVIGWNSPPTGVVRLTPQWGNLQASLGLSLTNLARLERDGAMVVSPFFGRRTAVTPADIFVIMPFSDDLDPIYHDHIKPLAKTLNRTVRRADDLFGSHSVMSDIWASIVTCKVVIADCTGRNPNVFYELGIAHTVGKPVVLITQSEKDVPFDIRHIRYLRYIYTPPGMREFEKALANTLDQVL